MFSSNTSAVSADANWIEECFSTHLYTGNGSTQTITTGIDLAGKGGMLWIKSRSQATNHIINDTARGAGNNLMSNSTSAQFTNTDNVSALSSTGFSVGVDSNTNGTAGATYASWTFRKQPKFFDVVTYTGTGGARMINHNLGSTPGMIIYKSTSLTNNWCVYHRSISPTNALFLNLTIAQDPSPDYFGSQTATATQFPVGNNDLTNQNGQTYVAYLFAHDAGGFGLTGTDNVISCGSFTTDGSGVATVNLGYEPQWVLFKFNSNDSWKVFDNMRGMSQTNWNELNPNTTGAEVARTNQSDLNIRPSATGFTITWSPQASRDCIYIAIRRGPMKTPTSGTSVFSPVARTGTGATAQITGIGFPPDLAIGKPRTGYAVGTAQFDRLRGTSVYLAPSWTDAEISDTTMVTSFNMDGISLGADTTQRYFNGPSGTYANWLFRRAPGFFDVVCYTGTGANRTVTHNLGVAPELMIIKSRSSGSYGWPVYAAAPGPTQFAYLDLTAGFSTNSTAWNDTAPTASVFTVGTGPLMNASGVTFVAYLFASCPGVSKVGSYTGNGSSQTINCGFTGGARFVMVKRTDSTGNWMVVDTARGLVSASDPTLYLNSTAAEVTGVDWLDPDNSGFIVNQESTMNANVNGATYIYLSIA